MKITPEKIQQVAALQWDVDITDEAAQIIFPEAQEFAWKCESEYQKDSRWQRRYFESIGEPMDDVYVEIDQRRFNAVWYFLYQILGKPCSEDSETDKIVPSEYFQKHGNKFDVENLPKKKWKTINEIPAPPKRNRKSRSKIIQPISAGLQILNDRLLIAGCPREMVEKYQEQLQVIADCGIELDGINVIEHQTLFSLKNGIRELTVDLIPQRCAIRLFGGRGIQKIYAHKKTQVISAIKWLKDDL